MNHLGAEFKFVAGKAEGDIGTFEGLGAVFGNVDQGGDIVQFGAFTKSLAERRPKLLLQHGMSEHGITPAGKFNTVEERPEGLYVKGQLFLETEAMRLAHRAMKEGELDGLSIGYIPKRWEWDREHDIRTLKEVDLVEISLVTWPMNTEATITTVKQRLAAGLLTERELESALRDAGLSRAQAKQVVLHGYRGLNQRDAGASAEIAAALKRLQTTLSGA